MATMMAPQALRLTQLKASASLLPVLPPPLGQLLTTKYYPSSGNFVTEIRLPRPRTSNRSSFTAQASTVAAAAYEGSIADLLGDVSIFTATGQPVKFRDLWDQNEGTAVVALLRHFGCPCCWELASVLKDSQEIFDSAGVKLIAVGVGTPNKARILADRLPFPIDCLYADPDRKVYNVLGLYYGFGRTFFNPASFSQDLRHSEIPQRTTQLRPLRMIEVVSCSREVCLFSKGKNCYMLGRMKGLVTMLP